MVRFVSLEIFATGVLERECALSSRTFSLVHSRRFLRLAVAILVLSPMSGRSNTTILWLPMVVGMDCADNILTGRMIEAGGTTMGKAFATLLVALMLMIGGGGIVHAGPLEDGVGAYKRGDYTTAIRILRPLADQGSAEAQFWLGAMYEHGRGVAHDYREARHWVRLAAEQGNALAQTFLGIAYGEGRGVIQDFQEALKWTRLAAEQGQAAAQLYLGFMYEEGIGVAQDYQRAYMWSDIAASKHGDDAILRAINQRDRIAKHLTAAQRLLAQQMARQCEASGFKNCE